MSMTVYGFPEAAASGMLFVRHVSGYTFTALTCKRTIVCGLLLIAVTALASFVLPNWSIVDPTRSETLFFLLFAAVARVSSTMFDSTVSFGIMP